MSQPSSPKKSAEILYHYTTSTGALGILDSSSIWATDINYVNDSQEIKYGMALANEEAKSLGDAAFRAYLEHGGASTFNVKTDPSWAIICFCEDGDLLSQWRGYGQQGYALGFDFSEYAGSRVLPKSALPGSVLSTLHKVEYDTGRQRRSIYLQLQKMADFFASDLSDLIAAARAKGPDQVNIEDIAENFFEYSRSKPAMGFYLSLIDCKNAAFKEEAEWRIVTFFKHTNLRFRETTQGLIPYGALPFNFKEGSNSLPLREVIVGPGNNIQQRVDAMYLLLRRYGYSSDQVTVRSSNIPFRE